MTSPTELLAHAVRADPARPRLTWYDGSSMERVELSGASLVNWVNKTAHLLIDDLGVEPGGSVAIDLPRHWLLAVWWLATDAVGATPILGGDPDAAVGVIGPDRLGSIPSNDEVVAVSLLPMAAAFHDRLPAPIRDYALEVRGQADQFTAEGLGDQAAGAKAGRLAVEWGLTPVDRALAVGPLTDPNDLVQGLLAPLAADASVVWVRNRPSAWLVEELAAERLTVGVGKPPPGSVDSLPIRWLPEPSVSC